jgi:uncharacterized repeat protein (TIGR01451 family)
VAVCLGLLACAVAAAAATVSSNFDNFISGQSINGQHGWRSGPLNNPGTFPGVTRFDEQVVDTASFYPGGVVGHGVHAWRFSNLYWSTGFSDQTFSPTIDPPVTENGPNTEFIAELSFVTARTTEQPGLFVSISPDNGAGGRMSLVQLVDAATGTEVIVWDTLADGNFTAHELAVLPHGVPHSIKFWMKLHPGENNDVVAILIDGHDTGQRFTSWENYYRHPGIDEAVPEINSLMFRVATGGFSEQDGGFLFFGETTSSDAGPGPQDPEVGVDKAASARTVHPGDLVRYTITARNRGHATARNFVVCDRIPRQETFVSADRGLRRIGSRRCLVIRRLPGGQTTVFHLTARVGRSMTAGRIDNMTDTEDLEDLTPPPLGPEPDIPGHVVDPRPTPEGGASVDVVTPAPAPPFTG